MGSSACCVTRLMGMTTFWTLTPEVGTAVPPVVPVAPVVTGGSVRRVEGEGVTPSLVTT